MTILEAMQEGYLLATGKSGLPDAASTKYDRLYGLCVKFHRDWAYERSVDWNSCNVLVDAGKVTATDTFELNSDTKVIRLSQRPGDYIRITTTDNVFRYTLKSANSLYQDRYGNSVSKVGQSLRFSWAFTADDDAFGGTIKVPAYVELEPITSVNQDVEIDNTAWLPAIVAAQYVLSDAQLSYQYSDLIQQAGEIMQGMIRDNNAQIETYSTGENFFDNGLGYSGDCEDYYA